MLVTPYSLCISGQLYHPDIVYVLKNIKRKKFNVEMNKYAHHKKGVFKSLYL